MSIRACIIYIYIYIHTYIHKLTSLAQHTTQRYTGVKVKFHPTSSSSKPDREVFIGIFPSGKAVLTGAVTWDEVDQVRYHKYIYI